MWDERFPDRKGQLKIFLLFSIQAFRKQVYGIASAESFCEEFEDMLSNFYCEEVCFTTQYPEGKDKVFTAQSYGSRDTFLEHCLMKKRSIFRNFFGKNKDTGKYWSTKCVLLEVLSSDDPAVPDFLRKNGLPRQVMKACLVQMTSSCDVERMFSVFTLCDTKLNQVAAPDEVEELIVMKETPTWEKFNSMSTTIM